MSDKTCLSNAELELTQRIQLHFPRGVISPEILKMWNSCPVAVLSRKLVDAFSVSPVPVPADGVEFNLTLNGKRRRFKIVSSESPLSLWDLQSLTGSLPPEEEGWAERFCDEFAPPHLSDEVICIRATRSSHPAAHHDDWYFHCVAGGNKLWTYWCGGLSYSEPMERIKRWLVEAK